MEEEGLDVDSFDDEWSDRIKAVKQKRQGEFDWDVRVRPCTCKPQTMIIELLVMASTGRR
jgi:hypothetical protein